MWSRSNTEAAHHEIVASAIATKLAHEIDPENKVGCMLYQVNITQILSSRDREGHHRRP